MHPFWIYRPHSDPEIAIRSYPSLPSERYRPSDYRQRRVDSLNALHGQDLTHVVGISGVQTGRTSGPYVIYYGHS